MLNLVALKVTIVLSRVKEFSHYDAYLPELGQDGCCIKHVCFSFKLQEAYLFGILLGICWFFD